MRTTLLASMLVVLALTAVPVSAADVYRLGPEDVVVITVLRHAEFSGELLVPTDGVVDLPAIGKLTVTGKTLAELSDYITQRLSGRLRNPEVAVTLKSQREQRVYVLGSVERPGVYNCKPGWRITESIASAGGIKGEPADCIVALMRATTGEQQRVRMPDILKGDAAANLSVTPGDVISVETVKMLPVYIIGQVKTPGMYPLRENGGILEAIALAGGVLETSALGKVTITHVNGKSETLDLCSAIQDGKHDVNRKLEPGDLVIVPESKSRISVLGYVNKPGYFSLRDGQQVRLSDALGLANGAAPKVACLDSVLVLSMNNGKQDRNIYDVSKFFNTGDIGGNPVINPGGVIYVSKSRSTDWDAIIRTLTSVSIVTRVLY